jgi:small subunit ribosomal protein S4
MSRYLGSVCKLCRREREKLFLKGEKCAVKCTLDTKRGKNLPGMQHSMKGKMTEYARHLREKQKARRIYGLTEEQFRHYFQRANAIKKGLTGDNLLKLLELRLDNIVYRLGIVTSRKMARQLVTHGNILVNDHKVDLPGYQLKLADKVAVKGKMKENAQIKKSLENPNRCPSWLELDKDNAAGTVKNMPSPEEFSHPINSQLIVELYSK